MGVPAPLSRPGLRADAALAACQCSAAQRAATRRGARRQGPFTYEAQRPEDIVFTPLKQKREFNARELMQVG
jgi:hypothetical protein